MTRFVDSGMDVCGAEDVEVVIGATGSRGTPKPPTADFAATLVGTAVHPAEWGMARFPRLTETHIRLVHREVRDLGAWPGLEHFTEEQYDEHLSAFVQDRPEGPVGIFAYGSLIWRPVFEPGAVLRASALGWHRAFTLRLKRFRGTPECPGLMMQIDRGGTCEGVLQMVPQDREWEILSDLWRREMTVRPPGNCPTWIEVEAEGKVRRAIAFTANPESQNYAGTLSPDEVAACLAEACGHWGTGAEYLLQTITALEREGIHDPHLWDLQERVAEQIEARFPDVELGSYAVARLTPR